MNLFLKSTIVRLFIVFFISTLIISLTKEANGDYGILENGKLIIVIVSILSASFYARVLAEADANIEITSHISRAIFRFILLSFFPTILLIQSGNYSVLWCASTAYASFYLMFDISYDKYRGKNLLYIGNTSIIDKFINSTIFGKYPILYFIYKLVIFIIIDRLTIIHYVR